MLRLFLLFVAQIPIIGFHEASLRQRNRNMNYFLYIIFAGVGPFCSLIALFINGYLELFK